MPCIFFYGDLNPACLDQFALKLVHREIGAAAGVDEDRVELHFAPGFTVVRADGRIETPAEHGVHIFIEWHEGRTVEQKKAIAIALQSFLNAHNRGKGADLTFRDSPRGQTFFLEGKLVE